MKYPKSIEAAIKYVLDGAQTDMPFQGVGGGRPSQKRIVNGIVLDRMEYDVYLCLVDFWKTAKECTKGDILTDEQFVVFMKEAAPRLNQRMIQMAMVSDDLKAVRAVAGDLADRGYGKSAAQLNINISDKDIRGAWKQLEDRGVIDVTNLIDSKVVDVPAIEHDDE